jgi:hypothetical protein
MLYRDHAFMKGSTEAFAARSCDEVSVAEHRVHGDRKFNVIRAWTKVCYL